MDIFIVREIIAFLFYFLIYWNNTNYFLVS